jgi:urease accessory protein
MYDAAYLSEPAALSEAQLHQRAVGELRLSMRLRGTETVLDGLRQVGCLKARFPRPERGAWTNAVSLNTSGGIAAGDRLSSVLSVGAGARATIAGQAAERCYRALAGASPARVQVALNVAEGAAMEWLPQETILFDRCALDRRLDIELAPDAWFLGVEAIVFGRTAMGEQVGHADFRDTIRVRRAGRLMLHDAVRMQGEVAAKLARPAVGGGACAMATLVHVSPLAEAALDGLRDALEGAPAEWGASAWDGMLVARFLAPDGAALREAVVMGLQALRGSRPLPRVWLC